MLYNVILSLSMKFGGCKFKNKDFMAYKPHFPEFFAVYEKWHFFRLGSSKSLISQKAFDEIECGFLQHLDNQIAKKRLVLFIFSNLKILFFRTARFAKKNVFYIIKRKMYINSRFRRSITTWGHISLY